MLFVYLRSVCSVLFFVFFFNDTATTEIYTLSLHDALPISACRGFVAEFHTGTADRDWIFAELDDEPGGRDRKSTRLNSSHSQISYAVFCLKKKKNNTQQASLFTSFLTPYPQLCSTIRHTVS